MNLQKKWAIARRWYCSKPEWVSKFATEYGAEVDEKGEKYRFQGWARMKEDVKERMCKGDVERRYRRINGIRFGFGSPGDNPVHHVPDSEVAVWWDETDTTPKVLVQLAPQFPPLLWIPLVPTKAALERLFDDFAQNDEKYLEAASVQYEKYLEAGQMYLAPPDASQEKALAHQRPDEVAPPVRLAKPSKQYYETSLVPWAKKGEDGDLYRRAAGRLSALDFKKDYEESHWYFLGTAISPEDIEMQMMGNPFVFGRWPDAVVGGEQRRAERGVFCSSFRTVYSKSRIVFTTREDEPHAAVNVGEKKYKELSGVYCCVNHPSSDRMAGGKSVVEWYNRVFGCDFPLTTPVDVVAALAMFRAKAASQVASEYDVVAGRYLDNTKEVAVELAKRQQAKLPQEEQDYINSLNTITQNNDPVIAQDVTHPGVVLLTQYIRRLAIMQHPEFESRCFKPFWSSDSKYVRIRMYEACLVAGRPDLAEILMSRESDPYVVSQIAGMAPKPVTEVE
eukprot:TRINITY_DN17355_c0_g1_i1.p1 TRINITY_DN17355_c0_g1~~TRINITY_DN17355_c0_g1_i1.p1  ORF type:complete len:506 (+),score=106.75 TRINITY_DN17355_c0_g1_i1:40-1557(+)